jgi:hypothetical protein
VLYISSIGYCIALVQVLWRLGSGTGTGTIDSRQRTGEPPALAKGALAKGAWIGAWLRPAAAVLCYAVVVAALAERTWRRNVDWRSHNALYTSAIVAAPSNPKNIYTLGVSLKEGGRWQEAEELYHRAFNLQPAVEDYSGAIGLVYAQDRQEVL